MVLFLNGRFVLKVTIPIRYSDVPCSCILPYFVYLNAFIGICDIVHLFDVIILKKIRKKKL
jgi:hypothetical protein